MAFKYQARNPESIEKRASQRGGEFEGFVRDEYRAFSANKGDNAIRVLPPTWEDAMHYGIDVWVHYSIGPSKASVICLFHMKKERCPICEFRALAERRDDEDEAKELRPSRRVLIWLINRREEEVGVLYWGMPWTADRDLAKACKDRETGKHYFIDHPEQGHDVYFDREGEGISTKYINWQVARRQSSVDQRFLDYIEKNPLPDILLWRTYDEVKALYEGAAATEKPARADTQESERAARNGHDDDPPFDADQRQARDDVRPEPRPASDDAERDERWADRDSAAKNKSVAVPSRENEPALPLGETPSAAARAAGLRARFSKR